MKIQRVKPERFEDDLFVAYIFVHLTQYELHDTRKYKIPYRLQYTIRFYGRSHFMSITWYSELRVWRILIGRYVRPLFFIIRDFVHSALYKRQNKNYSVALKALR